MFATLPAEFVQEEEEDVHLLLEALYQICLSITKFRRSEVKSTIFTDLKKALDYDLITGRVLKKLTRNVLNTLLYYSMNFQKTKNRIDRSAFCLSC